MRKWILIIVLCMSVLSGCSEEASSLDVKQESLEIIKAFTEKIVNNESLSEEERDKAYSFLIKYGKSFSDVNEDDRETLINTILLIRDGLQYDIGRLINDVTLVEEAKSSFLEISQKFVE